MKKFITITLSTLLLSCQMVLAQSRFTIHVDEGMDINSLVTNSRYVFPEFKAGNVVFADKTASKALLNYDMILGQMVFKEASGAVKILAHDPADITSIQIDEREFVHTKNGYVEVLAYIGDKALLLHRQINPEREKPTGAYGTPTDNSAVTRSQQIIGETAQIIAEDAFLLKDGNIVLNMTQTIYLQMGKNIYLNGNENNFQRLFGKDKKSDIRNFIKNNKLNLKKPTDLVQLFNYLADKI